MASYDIMIRGDIIPETDEQFTFSISTVNPADRVVQPSQGIITIIDDDEGKHAEMHCVELLTWHSVFFLFVVPDCGTPPDPGVNGQVNFTATIYLAEALYDCDLGYDLIRGAATRVCLLNGTWGGEDPVCQSELIPASQAYLLVFNL